MEPDPDPEILDTLKELAVSLGCDDAAVIPADKIIIDPQLAGLCLETRCPNYGLSPTCPPHVKGPEWIQKYIEESISHALFIKIAVKDAGVYADQLREISKLLHFIVIQLENEACELGLEKTIAFAGGSCRNIFCSEYTFCEQLEGNGECRYPDSSRPSVSGHGVNIKHLIETAGWAVTADYENKKTGQDHVTRYGLVLLGR